MPQQPNLYLDLTVYQNIMYFGLLKGGKKGNRGKNRFIFRVL